MFLRTGETDCHSQFGNWLRNDRGFARTTVGSLIVRRGGALPLPRATTRVAPTEGYKKCGEAGRCGERTERCRWQKQRSERVAAVKISSVRRKAAQKFWAPQQGHRPLRKITRSAVVIGRGDVGIAPYGCIQGVRGKWWIYRGLPGEGQREGNF